MLKGSGIKLALFLGLSALGHGLLLYPWSSTTTVPLISPSEGSYIVAIVAQPSTKRVAHTSTKAKTPQKKNNDKSAGETAKPAGATKTAPQPDRSRILAQLHAIYDANMQYPPLARRYGIEGQLLLGFEVLQDGSIHNVRILRSSGSQILDHAAIQTMQDLGTLSQLQAFLHGQSLNIELPVHYQLNED